MNHVINFSVKLLLFTCIFLYHPILFADPMDELVEMPLEELVRVRIVDVVTGSKQFTKFAPASTTVIDATDFALTGTTDLDDILEAVPGLHVARSPISYYNPIYALGGIASTYNPETLVLLNGIPINTLYTGGRILIGYGGMPTTMISRVEVIRGPGSALYGADALSGVINIITKNNKELDGTHAGMQVGSFERRDAWLTHGNSYQGWDIAVGIHHTDSAGQRGIIAEDAQTQLDKLSNTHLSTAPDSVNLSRRNWDMDISLAKNHWKFHTLYQKRNNIGLGAGVAQALYPEGRVSSERLYSNITYDNQNIAKNWSLTARANYADVGYDTEQSFVVYPPGALNGAYPVGMRGATGLSERQAYFDFASEYKGLKDHKVRLGAGYRRNEIYRVSDHRNFGIHPTTGALIPPTLELTDISNTPAAFIPTGDRNNWNLFAQDIWTLTESLEVTAGGRYDHYSDFGNTFNPRLALVWKTTSHFVTKFIYGKAFRAPSFQELYQENNPVALGNRDLKPEKIQSYEIAFDYRPNDKWHIALNSFIYDLTDKILFISTAGGNSVAQNAGSQKGRGIVIEGGWQLNEKLVLTGNYALQTATDQDDRKVVNVPKQDLYLRTDWKFLPNWHLNTQLTWIAGRKRALDDPRPPIDDYVTVDIALHYQRPKSSWNFGLNVRNLFDADVREPTQGPDTTGVISIPYDLPMEGVNFAAQVGYHF